VENTERASRVPVTPTGESAPSGQAPEHE
jgi:hypothetical protein